jgi:DNA adenine methylase
VEAFPAVLAPLLRRPLAAAARLQPVSVDNRPAIEVVTRYGVHDAVLYCDPPYLGGVRTSLTKRSGDYLVEYHAEEEHRELAEALRATPAAVVLSGYPSPLYEELYGNWNRLERRVPVSTSNRYGGTTRWATEVLWSNRPLNEQLALLSPEMSSEGDRPVEPRAHEERRSAERGVGAGDAPTASAS